MGATKPKIAALLRTNCRECINKKCQVRLDQKDCLYAPATAVCAGCGRQKQIVTALTSAGRLKTAFH